MPVSCRDNVHYSKHNEMPVSAIIQVSPGLLLLAQVSDVQGSALTRQGSAVRVRQRPLSKD